MSNISAWSNTAASNNAAAPDGWPEGQTAGSVNNCGREVMAAVRTWYEQAEFVDLGHTPTRVSGAEFTVATDLTDTYQARRRVRIANSGALIYGDIISSSYTNPNTTVTCIFDSGSITASVSAVAVGILNPSYGSPSGANFVQRAYTSDVTVTTVTTTTPAYDDTIPQNTEGDELITLAITPKHANNRLHIHFHCPILELSAAGTVIVALYQDSTANALEASAILLQADSALPFDLHHEMAAGTTSSTTFKIRVGVTTGTATINGSSSARKLGGVATTFLRIEEMNP